MYSVEFLSKAEKDISRIIQYIRDELYNSEAAESFTDKVVKQIENLGLFPKMHAIHDTAMETEVEFRKIVIGNYLVFYFIEAESVLIAFVIHQMQEVDRVLEKF